MKATIKFHRNDTEQGNIFNKTVVTSFHVTAKVALSEEEMTIVRDAKIGDAVIYERDASGKNATTPFIITYDIDKCISEGIHDAFNSPIKAREFAAKLKNDTLPSLKNYIEGNRPLETEPMVIEL